MYGPEKLIINYKGYFIEQILTSVTKEKEVVFHFRPCDKSVVKNKNLPKTITLTEKEVSKLIEDEFSKLGLEVMNLDDLNSKKEGWEDIYGDI